MKPWERLLAAGRKILHGDEARAPQTPASPPSPGSPAAPSTEFKRRISGWVEDRAQRVVEGAYESRAADLEERAMRVMSSVYEKSADDLEERAVRAMRGAIRAEAEHIKEAIEHGIAVKKREVRLSLLVLVVSSLVYLVLYWITTQPAAP